MALGPDQMHVLEGSGHVGSPAGALRYLESADATLVLNQAREESCTDWHVIDAHFRKASISRRVTLPYDEQLRSGTYALDALTHATRMPIKQLGVAVAEQLE